MQLDGGRYVLGDLLGAGGTAEVRRATDTALGVERAIKLVKLGPVAQEQRSRLRAEARAMAGIDHPNVLKVHDIGTEGDLEYIVMDLAPGGSLQDRLQDGPLPMAEACRHMIDVLGALEAAHDAGVVHRDVKPGNVLLDENGQAHLADFGIARIQLEDGADPTRTGAAMGSIPFMAPEQRVDPRTVTAAADLYATACTLYTLLTTATPIDLYLAPGRSPRWEGIADPLAQVIRKGTRAHPDERYADAGAMRRALVEAMHRLGLTDTPAPQRAERPVVSEHELYARPVVRSGRSSIWLAVAVLGVAILVGQTSHLWLPTEGAEAPVVPVPGPLFPESAAAPNLAGTWRGSWDDHPGGSVMVLEGDHDGYTGRLDIDLGGHTIKARVEGRYDPRRNMLVLEEPAGGVYTAFWKRGGLLTGTYQSPRPTDPVPFAFVHIAPDGGE